MRILKASVLFSAVVFGLLYLIPAGRPAYAQATPTVLHCGQFKAERWSMGGSSGNEYRLVIRSGNLSCKEAASYAKKLTMIGLSSEKATTPQEVRGGPQGYACFLTPDGSGHVFGGSCRQTDPSGKIIGNFDWNGLQ